MGAMFCMGACINCEAIITFNPHHVPSLTINGSREPLCRGCFNRWNEIHRTSKGLDPVPLHPEAYEPAEDV